MGAFIFGLLLIIICLRCMVAVSDNIDSEPVCMVINTFLVVLCVIGIVFFVNGALKLFG